MISYHGYKSLQAARCLRQKGTILAPALGCCTKRGQPLCPPGVPRPWAQPRVLTAPSRAPASARALGLELPFTQPQLQERGQRQTDQQNSSGGLWNWSMTPRLQPVTEQSTGEGNPSNPLPQEGPLHPSALLPWEDVLSRKFGSIPDTLWELIFREQRN